MIARLRMPIAYPFSRGSRRLVACALVGRRFCGRLSRRAHAAKRSVDNAAAENNPLCPARVLFGEPWYIGTARAPCKGRSFRSRLVRSRCTIMTTRGRALFRPAGLVCLRVAAGLFPNSLRGAHALLECCCGHSSPPVTWLGRLCAKTALSFRRTTYLPIFHCVD